MPPDHPTLKRLALIKQIYQRGLASSLLSYSPVDNLIAIIGLDLANETALIAVADTLKPKRDTNEKTFGGLVSQIQKLLEDKGHEIPLKNQLQQVHEFRNDAQHKAKYPTHENVSDCRAYTREFLSEIFELVWEVSFDQLSLKDSIEDEETRFYVGEAEQSFASGDYLRATGCAKAALQIATRGLVDSLVGPIDRFNRAFMITRTTLNPEPDLKTYDSFKKIRSLVAFQISGVHPHDYLRYIRFSQGVRAEFSMNGELFINRIGDMPSNTECEFIVSFVVNTAVGIEGLGEDILSPKADHSDSIDRPNARKITVGYELVSR